MVGLPVADAVALEGLGARWALRMVACSPGRWHGVCYLHGNLGSGKTTFVRGVLRGLGVAGTVRSPTYTLVEPYELPAAMIYHLDLYRLSQADEVEFLGLDDVGSDGALYLIEWPERGADQLAAPDLHIEFQHQPPGRRLVIRRCSETGRKWASALEAVSGPSRLSKLR